MDLPVAVYMVKRLRANGLVPAGAVVECRQETANGRPAPGGWAWRALVGGKDAGLGSPVPMMRLVRAPWRTETDADGRTVILPAV